MEKNQLFFPTKFIVLTVIYHDSNLKETKLHVYISA